MNRPEFDSYSPGYEELLKDPIRDCFTGQQSAFFHERKRDLIREYFRRRKVNTRSLRYLDVGCGKGELVSLLREDFGYLAGCDPSSGMLESASGFDTREQTDPDRIPFETETFDFVTAVCVYHHVPLASRLSLTREIWRVIKPGGVFAILEHNPHNPITRLIVGRTPVDADAILLRSAEARECMRQTSFMPESLQYFLYFPEFLYRRGGRWVEAALAKFPFGGQYAVFATKGEMDSTT